MDSSKGGKDTLTGLWNRKVFLRKLREVLPELRDSKQEVSFIFGDIDRFDFINKEYGHQAGDEVLIYLADLAQSTLGKTAIISRFGGDEFAAVLPKVGREESLLRMDQMRRTIEAELHGWLSKKLGISVPKPISISIGIAACPTDGRTEYELLRKASEALYRAKEEGRNQIRLARAETMSTKTTHYTHSQLERLSKLSEELGTSEAELLREGMDDLLLKYEFNEFLDRSLMG
ncbi:MAG: diguanylate cyclase [Anaerolineaceae bacterium]|nr:diguanylate cyclase [Anaerolineaceae bacterium]